MKTENNIITVNIARHASNSTGDMLIGGGDISMLSDGGDGDEGLPGGLTKTLARRPPFK